MAARDVVAQRAGRLAAVHDWLVEEVPVALVFNGISHAVMMASPDHLEDFAFGFALTEGLLDSPSELYGVDQCEGPGGLEVHLQVSAACMFGHES